MSDDISARSIYVMRIDDLALSTRPHNALKRHGFARVVQLFGKTKEDLLREVGNFGPKCYQELWKRLVELGAISGETDELVFIVQMDPDGEE